MPVKIRLQRQGKKGKPFFHIVAADSRAKRDGKYIERLGFYNPNTDPATIELEFDKALGWLKKGAQPTDTARAILSYKGVMLKNHLDNGVVKGAFSQDEAEKRFEAWRKEKEAKIEGKRTNLEKAEAKAIQDRLAVEKEQADAKAQAIAAKTAPEEETPVEEPKVEAATEETPEVKVEETPEVKVEETPEVKVEETPEVKAEETPEVKAEETPEVKAEETAEAKAEEEKKD